MIKSTYGINSLSRFALIPRNITDYTTLQNLYDAWSKGEMSLDSIKDISFSYKEFLKSSNEEMNTVLDNLTAGLRSKLNLFTKKLNMIGMDSEDRSAASEASGNSSKTAEAIMDLGAALSVFTNGTPDEIANAYQNMFSYALAYNVPVRTQNPSISLTGDKEIKINFGWGKAGLYNAKDEVWDPINTIISYLVPRAEDMDVWLNNGIYSIENMNTIPYVNQTKFFALKGSLKTTPNPSEQIVEGSEQAEMTPIELANSAVKELYSVDISKIAKDINKGAKSESEAWDTFAGQQRNAKAKGRKGKDWGDKREIITRFGHQPPTDEYYEDAVDWPKGYIENAEKNFQQWQRAAQAASEKYEESADKNGDLNKVLSYVSILPSRILGAVASRMKTAVDGSICDLNMCYLPKEVNNSRPGTLTFDVGSLGRGMNPKGDHTGLLEYDPLLTLTGIPELIKWGYDFSQPDEQGYPKAGYITISKLWAVDAFGKNISFSGKSI